MNNLRSSFSSVQPSVSLSQAGPTSGQPVNSDQSTGVNVGDALAIADQVLTDIETRTPSQGGSASVLPQVLPTVVQQSTDTLNPSYAGPSAKETLEGTTSPDVKAIDAGAGVQYVEQERNPEIPVEVESFIQKIDDNQDQLPTEIVIADGTVPVPQPHFPTHKVVVLPITPEIEAVGDKKDPSWSVKWLVEWSQKIMKMFTGHVIYRQDN